MSFRTYKEEGRKNHEMRWWKRIWIREACAAMMLKTETSRDDAAEECRPQLTRKKILPSKQRRVCYKLLNTIFLPWVSIFVC